MQGKRRISSACYKWIMTLLKMFPSLKKIYNIIIIMSLPTTSLVFHHDQHQETAVWPLKVLQTSYWQKYKCLSWRYYWYLDNEVIIWVCILHSRDDGQRRRPGNSIICDQWEIFRWCHYGLRKQLFKYPGSSAKRTSCSESNNSTIGWNVPRTLALWGWKCFKRLLVVINPSLKLRSMVWSQRKRNWKSWKGWWSLST